MSVDLFVPGEPISWSRAGRSGRATFTPKRVREAESVIAVEWWKQHPAHVPLEGRITLSVSFFVGTKVRRDIDNQLKLVMDALNGIAWVDDRQIDVVSATRRPVVADEVPGTWIRVAEIQPDAVAFVV